MKARDKLFSWLLPVLLAAVTVLAFLTLKTTLQVDKLREQSVVEATLGLAHEKADRLERYLINQDNTLMRMSESATADAFVESWLAAAARDTPTVRALILLDEDNSVVRFVSRAQDPFREEERLRRELHRSLIADMRLSDVPLASLRHLHADVEPSSYLLSYWRQNVRGRNVTWVAWHDVARIVRETLPVLYRSYPGVDLSETGDAEHFDVVDEEGRVIFGPPPEMGVSTVGVKFPSTLYRWRMQLSLTAGDALARRVEQRRRFEIGLVAFACAVVVGGLVALGVAVRRQQRLATLQSEFVANVSHELKTPLALIRMFAEMLEGGRISSDEKRAEYTRIILRESERLSSLIENVLDFSRVDEGLTLQKTEGDVADAVRRSVRAHEARAQLQGVQLLCELAPDHMPHALVDVRALEVAFGNLIDNAVKYGASGGRVRVSNRARPDAYEVHVRDYGPGVPETEWESVFRRFVRGARTATEPAVRGTGIGLSLVRQIVKLHGGRAYLRDVGPDETGALFVVEIPHLNRREKSA